MPVVHQTFRPLPDPDENSALKELARRYKGKVRPLAVDALNEFLPSDSQLRLDEATVRGGWFEPDDVNISGLELNIRVSRGPNDCLRESAIDLLMRLLQLAAAALRLVAHSMGQESMIRAINSIEINLQWPNEVGLCADLINNTITASWGVEPTLVGLRIPV